MSSTLVRLFSTVVLTALPSLSQSHEKVIFLVRHAEKASQDDAALLNDRGRKRAQCLAHTLADAGINAIFVTEAVRTQQTAEPLAQQLHLRPIVLGAEDVSAAVQKIRSNPANITLVVAHSNTLPKIIELLGGGIISPVVEDEYDRLFVFHTLGDHRGDVEMLRYCDCE
jgi:phosphohistidine phosphatase SixA